MSTLMIDYAVESNFFGSVSNAKSSLNKRIDDYVDIERRARGISSSNCDSCAYYIRKKINQLQDKVVKLNSFQTKVETFIDNAKETDAKVAGRIKNDTKLFKKRTGIGKTSKSLWSSIAESIKAGLSWIGDTYSNIKDHILDFYEKNKYWINIVFDVIAVAALVFGCIGTGGLLFAAGAFFVADSVFNLMYDGAAAYQFYHERNEAEAERLSEKGGKDAFKWVGGKLDDAFGTNFIAGTMGTLYSFAYATFGIITFYKTSAETLKYLKLNNIKVSSLFNGNKSKIKWSSHFNSQTITKTIGNFLGSKPIQQKDIVKLMYSKTLGFAIKNADQAKRILQGRNAIVVGKTIYENVNEWRKGNYNPFPETTKAVKEFYDEMMKVPSGGY